MDQFKENFKGTATIQVKLRLALEKIAELENIVIDDEAIEAQYKKLADENKMDVEKVKSFIAAESLAGDLKSEKAFAIVRDSAEVTVVEPKAE